ncbi:MAG: hypothetical protein ABWZ02_08225 [Nakamurella sp.]
MNRRILAGLGASACVIGLGLLAPGSASAAAETASYQATLNPITANNVTGTGASWITVNGNTADVKIQVNGLLDGVPHAQHIHIDAQGQCPSAPQQHNGMPSINVADGVPFYGAIGTSLTNTGDSSPAAALAVTDFPSTGSYTYSRTIDLDPNVVANLSKGTAVLVVHGIDYNNNGTYDDVLGASELDPTLPAEATNPALCGAFTTMQTSGVPNGAADTGGGSTAGGAGSYSTEIGIGAAALLAVGGAAVVANRRRRSAEG